MTNVITITYDNTDPAAINAVRSIRKFECLKVSRAMPVKSDDDKMTERMKKAAMNAKKLAASTPKTYSPKELMEILRNA